MLQLSSIDLQQEVQEALDSNLMLEEQPSEEDGALEDPDKIADDLALEDEHQTVDVDKDSDAPLIDPELDGDSVPDSHDELISETLTEELPVDSVWEDVFADSPQSHQGSATDGDYIDSLNTEEISLKSHLVDQLNLLNLTATDRYIAMSIVDSLDPNGLLSESLEELLSGLPAVLEVEMDELMAVLHLIQHLDPLGVATGDLRECLLVQLKSLPNDTPWRSEAIDLVNNYLQQLASRDFSFLMRKTRLEDSQLKKVIDLVQTLNPRPGSTIGASRTEYVEPDVVVFKENGRWVVTLNPGASPRIRVNPEYAGLVKRADNSSDNVHLRNQLQEARWFLKSLQQRNDTLLRVATKIVEYQRGFLDYGEQAMKPLVLHNIAEVLDLHESTISRVTTHKYMHTPSGIYELKYFFSSHVSTHAGGEISSTAIRALIKKLVAEENPRKPLSDNKIASLLAAQDIKIARRTIAKYRESLMIPPSNERKQLV